MAQQREFNLAKPPAYHYDFLLLAGLVSTRCCWTVQLLE
jgi:hypothetical protein